MILCAHPDQKVIEPMPNFYESAAIESGYKKPQPKPGLSWSEEGRAGWADFGFQGMWLIAKFIRM
jgi:hypothetical protein